ncbi:MAG TPA: LCP family protein [Candidatus Atribacteria bacterium]|nr:LCP family protein [Candidatus Atribacteria bacterium]
MSEKAVNKKKVIMALLLALLILLLALFATVYIYLQQKLSLINRPEPLPTIGPDDEFFETEPPDEEGEDNEDHEEMDPEEIRWPSDSELIRNKNIINILLIGQDRRPGEKRARSDSMMIATINKEKKTITLTSLMRDMYVQIPGYSDNRINAAYLFGGMELLDKTIEKNFGVHIDGNIEVDFDGFKEVIDKIGGIDIPLNEKEAKHLKKQGFGDLEAGMVHMDGELALAYARIRKVGNADYERTERQRRVLTTVFNKVKDLPLSEILKLVDVIFPLVTTDMTNGQIIALAYTVYGIHADEIATYRIPVDGGYKPAMIRKMAVLVPDLDKNRAALRKIIYGE